MDWIKQHKWYVIAGIGGLLLFVYLWLRSQSSGGSSSVVIPPPQPTSPPVGGGTSTGALNLSSGSPVGLSGNLVPPNCGPGMTPVPNIISGGPGQPQYLIGWQCQPTSNSNPPPGPVSGGCPMPDCQQGFHLWTPPSMLMGLNFANGPWGGPHRPCPVCVPDVPTLPTAPVPATPVPIQANTPPAPAAKTVTVCPWPNWCGSLWGIAQQHTGSGANWPALYAANKQTIGANPNLIKPGQVLTLPSGW